MPASRIKDAKRWRDRAEEARAVAELMSSEQSRQSMLRIADGYEHLAERAELEKPSGQVPNERDPAD